MPKVQCSCGAKYRFDGAAVGKKARCRKCGEVFTVPDEDREVGPIALADVPLAEEAAAAAARASEAQGLLSRKEARFDARPQDYGPAAASPPLPVPGRHARRYFNAVLWTLLFPTEANNLATLIIIWIMLSLKLLLGFAGCLGLIGVFIIDGWFAAFCLNTVLSAANGEENLPSVIATDGWLDGIVIPLIKFIVARTLVVVPVVVYLVFLTLAEDLDAGLGVSDYILGAVRYGDYSWLLDDLLGGGRLAVAGFLLLFGLFLWPMFLLVVAVGGFAALLRVDLMLATIVRSLPGYLCTVALVLLSTGLVIAFNYLAGLSKAPGLSSGFLVFVATTGLVAYADIVTMRVIGLYYHHFKHRFAWSWG